MTHAEIRQQRNTTQCAAGDPRALLLAATPPQQRSEVAARYDHAIEATELETAHAPTQEELDRFGVQLWRAAVSVTLAESSSWRGIVERYMEGLRVSEGMGRDIISAEASTPYPTAQEIREAWDRSRALRREYLSQRYGI